MRLPLGKKIHIAIEIILVFLLSYIYLDFSFIVFFLYLLCLSTYLTIKTKNKLFLSFISIFLCLTIIETYVYTLPETKHSSPKRGYFLELKSRISNLEYLFYAANGTLKERNQWYEPEKDITEEQIKNYKICLSNIKNSSCFSQGYYAYEKDTKTAPFANIKVRHGRKINGELVFDATYSTDEIMGRKTKANHLHEDLYLFTGCSFTYGEGLQDNQTAAYYFSKKTNYSKDVRNLSFHGWGGHNVLALLQSKRFNNYVKQNNKKLKEVYIVLLWGWGSRGMGLYNWSEDGPKYIIGRDGFLKQTNKQIKSDITRHILKILRNMSTYAYIEKKIYNLEYFTVKKELKMFTAQIKTIDKYIKENYNIKPKFLYWDWDSSPKIGKTTIKNLDIDVTMVSKLINLKSKKAFIPKEYHPSAYANQKIAQYFYEKTFLQSKKLK